MSDDELTAVAGGYCSMAGGNSCTCSEAGYGKSSKRKFCLCLQGGYRQDVYRHAALPVQRVRLGRLRLTNRSRVRKAWADRACAHAAGTASLSARRALARASLNSADCQGGSPGDKLNQPCFRACGAQALYVLPGARARPAQFSTFRPTNGSQWLRRRAARLYWRRRPDRLLCARPL